MIYQEFELLSREGETLRADIRYEATGNAKPVILFLHGFKGFKDWGPFPMVREQLAEAGFVSIGFNFSHNGIGPDLQTFTELDRFAHNTFSRELDETMDMLAAISNLECIPIEAVEMNRDQIGLLAHSRGAGMAILAGRHSSLVRAVCAWAPTSNFNRYSERQKERWRRDGFFDAMNHRTKQVMRISVDLLDDLERHPDRLNIIEAARCIGASQKPLLTIVGSEDLTTKPDQALAIAESAGSPPISDLVVITRAGHTFGATHPFKKMSESMEEVVWETKTFFTKFLIQEPSSISG